MQTTHDVRPTFGWLPILFNKPRRLFNVVVELVVALFIGLGHLINLVRLDGVLVVVIT